MDEESLNTSLIHSNGNGYPEFVGDLPSIEGWRGILQASWRESKKLCDLAGPAIFTSICRYSLGVITQAFAGHIGDLELATVSIENSIIAGFSMGIMIRMASALETLCGQAFGAKQFGMLGVYMERSWIILFTTALFLSPIYVWAAPILKLIGQEDEISDLAGNFAVWMLPQLFAHGYQFSSKGARKLKVVRFRIIGEVGEICLEGMFDLEAVKVMWFRILGKLILRAYMIFLRSHAITLAFVISSFFIL